MLAGGCGRSAGGSCLSLGGWELGVTGGVANRVLQAEGGLFAWETPEDGALRALCMDILGSLDVSLGGMSRVSCPLPCCCGRFLASGQCSSWSPMP